MPDYRKDVMDYYADLLAKRERLRAELSHHPEGSDAHSTISSSIERTNAEINRLGITAEEAQKVSKLPPRLTSSQKRWAENRRGMLIALVLIFIGASIQIIS